MKYNETIIQAVNILRNGGIILYPTDTAFGIGCRMDDKKAVCRLFTIRKRSETKAVPVLVNSREMALRYFRSPSNIVRRLMEEYWPGALTIISSCQEKMIPPLVRGGTSTIGLRMPDHEIPLSLISNIQIPILGPSANFTGNPTPFHYEELDPHLVALVDFVIPGTCKHNIASTVVDCSTNTLKIIRQGEVTLKLSVDI